MVQLYHKIAQNITFHVKEMIKVNLLEWSSYFPCLHYEEMI